MERQTGRQAGRQADRQTSRQTDPVWGCAHDLAYLSTILAGRRAVWNALTFCFRTLQRTTVLAAAEAVCDFPFIANSCRCCALFCANCKLEMMDGHVPGRQTEGTLQAGRLAIRCGGASPDKIGHLLIHAMTWFLEPISESGCPRTVGIHQLFISSPTGSPGFPHGKASGLQAICLSVCFGSNVCPLSVCLVRLTVRLSICSGSGYVDPATAASIISDLKSSGTLAGFNEWSVAYDVENNYWSKQVQSMIA
jgi:hypothetical protein